MSSDLSEGIRMLCIPLAVATLSSVAIRIVSTLSELATPRVDVAMHLYDRMRVSA
jgi:hypothetical protein